MPIVNFDDADPERNLEYFNRMLAAEVDAATLVKALTEGEEPQIVDVRDEDSYRKGHVKGAVNIPVKDLAKRMDELDKKQGVVVYCYDPPCMLSVKVAGILARKGYRVKDIGGGYENLVKNDAPIEKGAPEITH